LLELDAAVGRWLPSLRADDWLVLTADHGNDPTTPSTDHSREAVPVLVVGPHVQPVALGERSSFADVGATVAERLGVAALPAGTSFLGSVIG
jgi:phosphopentomutase